MMERVRRRVMSRKSIGNVITFSLLGLWYVLLAPTVIGGPAAYIAVSGHSMDGTYRTGDLVVTRVQGNYAKGDIVAFKVDGGGQVIHRIIGGNGERGYTVQGDNNPHPDPWHPTDDEVIGKSWLHFPQKAYVLDLPTNPMFAGVSAGLLTLMILLWDARPRRKPAEDATPPPAEPPRVAAAVAATELEGREVPESATESRRNQGHVPVA